MRSQPWCSPKSQTWRSNLKNRKTLPPNHHSSSTKESGYTCCLIGLYRTDYSIFSTGIYHQTSQVSSAVHCGCALNYSTSHNPSFSMSFVAEMTVKNPNFGYFSYGITSVSLS
ncbi:hypothetical protein Godav_029297 [Gossypium davidsonii]|uniref:Uncharacterized protein n=2 Tax=Gossypium TaxID=3633 RepID=A0A7J8T6U6_GOSDV|nr:hypothetical protein [Gossypium davidsonii]MBA0653594.1 hypothetical protein [Gossypium klotzschianum]